MNDYHLHTKLCKHAVGEMYEYIESAIEKGIKEICFTDHIPLPDGFDSKHRMQLKDMDIYLDWIESYKKKYKEISILAGVEADYIEGYEDYLESFISKYPFDLVIMSVHFVKQWPQGQWVFSCNLPDKSIKQIYNDYFEAVLKGINTGFFDIVGHLDLIKKSNYPVLQTNSDDIDKILNRVFEKGMSIEVNTSGLHKPIKEIYPSFDILKKVIKKSIPISLASDSHSPEYVGYKFNDVIESLLDFEGVKLASYKKRHLTSYPLTQEYI